MSKHKVEITCDLSEPALIPATFDLIRLYARAYGLPDVGHIYITLQIEFQGHTYVQYVDKFSDRLDQLWLGQVTKRDVEQPKEVQQ